MNLPQILKIPLKLFSSHQYQIRAHLKQKLKNKLKNEEKNLQFLFFKIFILHA